MAIIFKGTATDTVSSSTELAIAAENSFSEMEGFRITFNPSDNTAKYITIEDPLPLKFDFKDAYVRGEYTGDKYTVQAVADIKLAKGGRSLPATVQSQAGLVVEAVFPGGSWYPFVASQTSKTFTLNVRSEVNCVHEGKPAGTRSVRTTIRATPKPSSLKKYLLLANTLVVVANFFLR